MGIVESIALVPTTILLLFIISEYFLILLPKKKYKKEIYPTISVLIPAHNEEKNIANAINSILKSDYKGAKEIIVVDDGSTDDTSDILKNLTKKELIKTIRTKHRGKANALNRALKMAKNEIIVVFDADGEARRDALTNLVKPFVEEDVGAVSGITRVKNMGSILSWFQNLEYSYFSFFNSLCEKINAVLFTPGVLSAYKREVLKKAGGFGEGFIVEDCETTLKIHRTNHKVVVADEAIAYTVAPESIIGLFKQRLRWARGIIQVIKSNKDILFDNKNRGIGFYSLPMLSYWYLHAIIMLFVISYQIIGGYYNYFLTYSNGFSIEAFKYFFYWFSFFGMINLVYQIYMGSIMPSLLILLSILITFLSYGFYIISFLKYEKKITFREIVVLTFFFPYVLLILIIQLFGILEIVSPTKETKWIK